MNTRSFVLCALLGAGSFIALQPSLAAAQAYSGHDGEALPVYSTPPGYILAGGEDSAALKAQLLELRTENRKIAQSLADMTNKALHFSDKEDAYRTEIEQIKEALREKQEALKALEEENASLIQQVAGNSNGDALKNIRQEVETLRQQNLTLRQTVAEQNDFIAQAKNPGEEVSYLRAEIKTLKEKLALGNIRTESDREMELLSENKRLKDGIEKRDEFIKRMELLKVAAQALKAENEKLTQELETARNNSALPDVNAPQTVPQQTMVIGGDYSNREPSAESHEMMVAYRKKIREYQVEIARLKEENKAAVLNSIETAAGNDDPAAHERQIAKLLLENQELRTRLELLSGQKKQDLSNDFDADINVVSVDARVKQAGAVASLPQETGNGNVVYKMPRESMEMLRARGVLK